MTPITQAELEELLQAAKKDICERSGGEFGERDEIFFSAGFRMAVLALTDREIVATLVRITTGKEN